MLRSREQQGNGIDCNVRHQLAGAVLLVPAVMHDESRGLKSSQNEKGTVKPLAWYNEIDPKISRLEFENKTLKAALDRSCCHASR